ncbi:MAG: tetratricopeptide repeat protein [Alphaproteobacteria bacterium]|nr:tetratricopeptide repeat protein [Alphaproteobacteria bacterium]
MYFRLFSRLIIPAILACFLIALPASAQDADAVWQQENDAAIAAFQNGDYANAELHMKKALKRAEALGQNDWRYAMSVGDLGAVYYWQERYDDAEPYLKRGLALRQEQPGLEKAAATSAHFLGQVYYSRGDYAAAIPPLAQAVAIREKVLGPDDGTTLDSLDFLASARASAGEYTTAIPLFERLLAARTRSAGADSIEAAAVHDWLGVSYEQTGDTRKAAKHLIRANEIRTKLSGPDDPDLAWGYAQLARVYEAAGKPKEAERAFGQELAILEKVNGKDSPHLLDTLYRMVDFYRGQGREKDAATVERRIKATPGGAASASNDPGTDLTNMLGAMAAVGQKNRETEDAWNKATQDGQAAYAEKNYEKARERYAEALDLSRLILLADSRVAVSYNNLATAYWGLGQISEADVNFLQAVDLGAGTPEMNPAEMKVILGNYASFLRAQNRVKEAESMEARSAAIP